MKVLYKVSLIQEGKSEPSKSFAAARMLLAALRRVREDEAKFTPFDLC